MLIYWDRTHPWSHHHTEMQNLLSNWCNNQPAIRNLETYSSVRDCHFHHMFLRATVTELMFYSLFAFAIIRGSSLPVLFQSCNQMAHRGGCVKITDMAPGVGFKKINCRSIWVAMLHLTKRIVSYSYTCVRCDFSQVVDSTIVFYKIRKPVCFSSRVSGLFA